MPRELKVGDRICLISMAGDPNPIQVGETGTIVETYHQGDPTAKVTARLIVRTRN